MIAHPETRTLFLHLGLHKTGTTSLQSLLSSRVEDLRSMGVLYPRAGRRSYRYRQAQHNLAWEISRDSRFIPRRGTIRDLLVEIGHHPGNVVLSSEDFVVGALHGSRFFDFLEEVKQLGFAVVLIVVLREQTTYAFSLYAEMVANHGMATDFRDFTDEVTATGEFRYRDWRFPFDYYRLLLKLVDAGVAVRPLAYEQTPNGDDLIPALLRAMALEGLAYNASHWLNNSPSEWRLVHAHYRNNHGLITPVAATLIRHSEAANPHIARYRPEEKAAIEKAFQQSNAKLAERWDVHFVDTAITGADKGANLYVSDLLCEEAQRLIHERANRDWGGLVQRRLWDRLRLHLGL